jgi:hypothetical protein
VRLKTFEDVLTTPTLFRGDVTAKEWSRSAALYSGPFLDAFVLADDPELERCGAQ